MTDNTLMTIEAGRAAPLGLSVQAGGLNVAVWAPAAHAVYLCVFDAHDQEVARLRLPAQSGGVHHGCVDAAQLASLMRGSALYYGLRADGPYAPEQGDCFDVSKLLIDPYATAIDRPFYYDARMGHFGVDTAALVPKCVWTLPAEASDLAFNESANPSKAPLLDSANLATPQRSERARLAAPPKLIYELNVKAMTMQHPEVPAPLRGTVAALKEPCIIQHLQSLGVDVVELMPITAWMDERHLTQLGLSNAWGYNPVAMMVPDPRICPGGVAELRDTVTALAQAGIRTVLDVVFNHTAESDSQGATVSLRGLGQRAYYHHTRVDESGRVQLINDTGCGNTLACDRTAVVQLLMDTMRHWMQAAGVAGFRFDLAPIMGRVGHVLGGNGGFQAEAPLLSAIAQDPLVSQALLIAEPWDIGMGGYQLGQFGADWLEWNDKYRDDVRRYWRGDKGSLPALATRLAGSSDVFGSVRKGARQGVNFMAAHDGFTLRDMVSYVHKHNHANGEDNRDGHDDNISWNHGVEGELPPHPSDAANADAQAALQAARRRDVRAMLATLMLSQGTPMITAGDELGRTQHGNNNAYAQDNATTWIDWANVDANTLRWMQTLAPWRARLWHCNTDERLSPQTASWHRPDGQPMQDGDWAEQDAVLLRIAPPTSAATPAQGAITATSTWWLGLNNRFDAHPVQLPPHTRLCLCSSYVDPAAPPHIPHRSVALWEERHA